MKLQGRNLSLQIPSLQGEDVKLLQSELQQLGYAIPPTEYGIFLGPTTSSAVLSFQGKNALPTTGIVDGDTARQINAAVDALNPAPQNFLVKGQIRQADGSVFAGAIVRAVDKELRTEQPLGQAITDVEGGYAINYTSEQLSRDEKGSADLIVRVYTAPAPAAATSPTVGGASAATAIGATPLVSSSIIFNAPAEITVDLMAGGGIYAGASEYEQLSQAIKPALQGLSPTELTAADVAFLAGETELPAERIGFFAAASTLARQTDLPPEAFYGFAREKLPTDLPALLAAGQQAQQRALLAALDGSIIPLRLRGAIDSILQKLQQHLVLHVLDGMQPAGQASLGAALGTVLPDVNKQQTLITLWLQRTGTPQDFWKSLSEHPDFNAAGQIQGLKMTIQLGVLAQHHLPMLQQLQTLRQQGQLQSLRDLAKLDTGDWLALINTSNENGTVGSPPDMPGKDDAEKARNYATFMVQMVEKAFPTAVVAARIGKENPRGNDLTRFFANSPDFEFGATHIEGYIAANNAAALMGVQAPDTLTKQLKAMQRVFTVAPHYEHMKVLQDAGFNSAHSITRMGQGAFVRALGDKLGGNANAEAIFTQAERTAAAAMAVFAKFAPAMNSIDLAVTRRQP